MTTIGMTGVTVRDFLPGRPNVWGVRKGGGGGKCLLLVGHTDVVHVRGWRERWAGTDREDPFGAPVVNGEVWGRGAADLKAGIATAIEALRALDEARTELAGDVVLAFIGDEESGEPGTGVSAGMKALVPLLATGELPRPDFAIYVEPTTLDVYPAQMGFFIADIEVTGRTAYFGVPELGADALKATHAILAALWAHSADLERRGDHNLVGRSFLLVTAIEGGGLIAVPERCRPQPHPKAPPGRGLVICPRRARSRGARRHRAIRTSALPFPIPPDAITRSAALPPRSIRSILPVAMLTEAIRARRPDRGRIAGAPFWSEASFLTALGIPTVYFAPGDIRICHTLEERVPVEDYLDGIAALADFIARYCGVAK